MDQKAESQGQQTGKKDQQTAKKDQQTAKKDQKTGTLTQLPLYQKAKKAYTSRHKSSKQHYQAFLLWKQLADQHPRDLEAQIWCARTAYYAGHRVRDTNKSLMKKIFKQGMQCRRHLLKWHAKSTRGQIWAILINFKHSIADSFIPPVSKIEKVVRQLEKMVAQKTKNHMPFMMLGALYRELPGWPVSIGDEKKSMRYLKQGLKYAGTNAEYLLELAATYQALDQDKLARQTYQKCIKKGSGHADLQWEAQDARQWAKHMLSQLD